MKINLLAAPATSGCAAEASPSLEAKILRMVAGVRERRAIQLGQVDAIIDPKSGRPLLLPNAQAALLEGKARFRSLVELTSDGYWEQDEHYRFVLHTGATIGNELAGGSDIIGKTLWELPFDNDAEIDWQAHRTQLEWRAIFRDLGLRCVDRLGRLRTISISGEPIFDAVGHFKGYRGITRESTGHKEPPTDTSQTERLARDVLDALTSHVCVLDGRGTVLAVNAAWRVLAKTRGCLGRGLTAGSNYLAACDHSEGHERIDALALAAGIRQVLAGERAAFRHEYCCDATDAERCWFSVHVTRADERCAARAIVAYHDITDIKQTEELLRLERAVDSRIADNDTVSATVRAVIREVCDSLKWDYGRYFRLLPDTKALCMDESASASTMAVPQDAPLMPLRLGAGIAGRVAQSGQPLWMLASDHDTPLSTTALAFESGLTGVFAFPVTEAHQVCGVLEFVGHIVRAPDDRFLQTVRNLGLRLGRYLAQRRADDALRCNEERFRRLTELSSDWIWRQDSQFRFTEIVGTGIAEVGSMIGKTLWELPNILLSDEGWSKHKSELAARWSFCDFEIMVALADGQRGYYRISGEPTYDAAGIFSGFHGTALDITQDKRREIAAQAPASA
jgi:PAS domain-containing protein